MADYDFLYDLHREDFCARGLHYRPRIQYGREHPRQFMECVYKDGSGNRPVLVWVHGGGWQDDNLTPTYRPEKILAELAEKGYFVACIEYRLAIHAPFPACVSDCQTAVRYIREHAGELGVNPDRIAVWGESAGAHVASMTGLNFNDDPDAGVQAVVAWFCPSDLIRQAEYGGESTTVSRLVDCDAPQNPDKVRAASPIAYAAKKAPPFLLMHGDVDDLVPYEQSVEMHRALREAGNDARLITVPGQGHGFFKGESYYREIHNFLRETIGL